MTEYDALAPLIYETVLYTTGYISATPSRHRAPTDAGTLARRRARDVVLAYDVPVLARLALRRRQTRKQRLLYLARPGHLAAVRRPGAPGPLLVAPPRAVPLQRALGALPRSLQVPFLKVRHLRVGGGASRICRFCFFVGLVAHVHHPRKWYIGPSCLLLFTQHNE